MRIPEGFANFEEVLTETYEEHPFEALALANGFTCKLLELLTDKYTATKFCKDSATLIANLIKSYMNQNSNQSSEG